MMIGGGAALGGMSGLTRGLLQKTLTSTPLKAAVQVSENPMLLRDLQTSLTSPFAQKVKGFAEGFEPALPLVLGGAGGYLLADDDDKLLGTSLGIGAGLLARPLMGKLRNLRA